MTVVPDMGTVIRAVAWIVGALLAATLANDSWAGRGGGHGGHGGRSAAAGASHYHGSHGYYHHHYSHGSAFFIGGTYWPYFPPPYYYPPGYYAPGYGVPYRDPGTVYVERFDGTPTPETEGEIFCPSAGAYYPDVSDCPGGWQRVIRPAS